MKISIVSPFHNEENNILTFIREVIYVLEQIGEEFEIILVDDGSKDNWKKSLVEIKNISKNRVQLIELSRNFGKEWALSAGIAESSGDVIVIMDSDLQDQPSTIPFLVEKIKQGYDVVHARSVDRQGESWIKKTITLKFYQLIKYLTKINLPSHPGNFMAITKIVKDSLVEMPEQNRYFKMMVSFVGFDVAYVDFVRPTRSSGNSKFHVFKLISLAMDIIFSYSVTPLRLFSFFNLFISVILICISLWGIYQKVILNNSSYGWASMFLVVSIGFSLLFMFLSILSEYISRILSESKRRPLFIIKEKTIL